MLLERYCVVDVETTGFSPWADRIVEVACALVDGERVVERWATLVDPGMPIPPRATAVHGITDAMVAGAPPLQSALKKARRFCRGRIVAAHSARFDLSFVGRSLCSEAVCTLRLSRALFPEAPNHRNQTLRWFLDIDRASGECFDAHRALADAVVTAYVLIACRSRFGVCRQSESWSQFIRRFVEVSGASHQRSKACCDEGNRRPKLWRPGRSEARGRAGSSAWTGAGRGAGARGRNQSI